MKKYGLRILLAIAALLIWGNNLIHLFRGSSPDEEESWLDQREPISFQEELTSDTPTTSEFVYRPDFKDPFLHRFYEPPPKKVTEKKPKPIVPPPPKPRPPLLRWTGIMQDAKGLLGVIVDERGETWFVQDGDSVGSVLIQTVGQDSIGYQFNHETYWLYLNR